MDRDRELVVLVSEGEERLLREAADGPVSAWLLRKGLEAARRETRWFGRGLTATGSGSWTCVTFWPREP